MYYVCLNKYVCTYIIIYVMLKCIFKFLICDNYYLLLFRMYYSEYALLENYEFISEFIIINYLYIYIWIYKCDVGM